MSTSDAIAALSYSLRRLLQDELSVLSDLSPVVQVGPPLDPAQFQNDNIVRLYVHAVRPNPTLRSISEPPDGRKRLALEVDFLLSFHGTDTPDEENTTHDAELAAQRMLGRTLLVLHRRTELPPPPSSAPTWVSQADHDQPPRLADLELQPLDTEARSKLWSTLFQVRYSLSVAYTASIMLLESDEAVAPAPPVQVRNIEAFRMTHPVIASLEPRQALAGDVVTIRGEQLAAEHVTVSLGGQAVPPDAVEARAVTFTVPTSVRAGGTTVSVLHERRFGSLAPGDADRVVVTGQSEPAPLLVVPAITKLTLSSPQLELEVAPVVRRFQRLVVLFTPPDASLVETLRVPVLLTSESTAAFTITLPGATSNAVARDVVIEVDGVRSAGLPLGTPL